MAFYLLARAVKLWKDDDLCRLVLLPVDFVLLAVIAGCILNVPREAKLPHIQHDILTVDLVVDPPLRHYGPLIPFVMMISQFALCRHDTVVSQGAKHPGGLSFAFGTLLVMVLVILIRILLYVFVLSPYSKLGNDYTSDHIFLVLSMVACLQVQFFYVHKSSSYWRHVTLSIGAVSTLWVSAEAFITAMYWHTRIASCTGFLFGVAFFIAPCTYYVELLRSADEIGQGENSNNLLLNGEESNKIYDGSF